MPKGPTHTRATVGLTVALSIASFAYVPRIGPASLAMIPGCLLGILVSPDLDVRRGSYSHFLIYKYIGVIPERVWFYFWFLYSRMIPHHRSLWSHGPIIGTLIRVIYIIFLTGGFCLLAQYFVLAPLFWFFVGGLALSDLLHEIMDCFG